MKIIRVRFLYLHVPAFIDLLRTDDRSSKRPTLDIHTAKVPVLSPSAIVTLAGQTKDTQMPISAIARGTSSEGASSLDERVVAS